MEQVFPLLFCRRHREYLQILFLLCKHKVTVAAQGRRTASGHSRRLRNRQDNLSRREIPDLPLRVCNLDGVFESFKRCLLPVRMGQKHLLVCGYRDVSPESDPAGWNPAHFLPCHRIEKR